MLPGPHGCTGNILDGLVFIQLTQDSCPSVSSGNVAFPLLLHTSLCSPWYDTGASHFVVSQMLFLLLPSWLHSLSQTWLSSCVYLPVRDVIHGSATSVLAIHGLQPSLWNQHVKVSSGSFPGWCWCTLTLEVYCFCSVLLLLLFLILLLFSLGGVVCFFCFKQIFSHLFAQCWGWMHGLQRARQPSHHWATFPIHSVPFIPDGYTRSLSNLNFPLFSRGLVLPARSIFCCSKSI